jgi:hypothetical protein
MITQARFFASDALPTTLASPLGTTGNPSVASLPGTWPSQYPYTVLIDWGQANQEAISVTGPPTGSGPFTLPCTRGIDGSTGGAGGLAHASSAIVVHGVTAQDFTQPLQFIDGLSGYPWEFNVMAYGAKGDTRLVSDAAVTASSATVTCATSAPFTSTAVDGGKTFYMPGAGAAGAPLLTTISAVLGPTQATLAVNASTTVAAGGAAYGTDDTAAINAAVAAAVAWAQAAGNSARVRVLFPDAVFMCATAPTIGGATAGNAVIPLPVIPMTSAKITLEFLGLGGDVADCMHWLQTVPQASGSVLLCPLLTGTNDVNNGPTAIIGGPYNGYGAGSTGNTWSNVCPAINGIRALVPLNSTVCGFDFFGCAEASVPSASCMPLGVVPSGAPWPQISVAGITNQWTFGLRMPSTNNNDRCDVGYFTAEGICYGWMPSEHTVWESTRSIECITGIEAYSGRGQGMTHSARGKYSSVEACTNAVGAFDGNVKMSIETLDVESTSKLVFDPSNRLAGTIGYTGDTANTVYQTASINNSATGVRCINLATPSGPVASPHAAPASGAAWLNGYYRDAWITLSATTITALNIDSTAQNGLGASPATYTFLLPSGHSYTPTYTGTLTHTVSLL